jgi:membrane-associated phospholipid phosphatase
MTDAMVRRHRNRDLAVAVVAGGGVLVGALAARRGRWLRLESRVFDAVNGLDQRGHSPAWILMQFGSLGGSLATAGLVALSGHGRLGRRLGVVGTVTWLASKVIKPLVGRGRPAADLAGVRVLGREQSGLGYPSGHAAVAVAMASALEPHLPPRMRPLAWAGALGVGATRMYVGAHLPLDIVGGVALGVGTERVVRLINRPGLHGSS